MSSPPAFTACFTRPLPERLAAPEALERLRDAFAPWLLESAPDPSRTGGFSFVGADPYLVLRSRGLDVEVECRRAVHEGLAPGATRERRPTLEALRARLPRPPAQAPEFPFCGGAVGLFGYELAEQLDVHRLHGKDDLGLPDALWLFVDALVAYDAGRDEARVCGLGFADAPDTARERARSAAERLAARLARPPAPPPPPAPAGRPGPHTALEVAAYHAAVEAASQEIAAGRIYQACLTYRSDLPFASDPWRLYRELRRRDPAPFAAYFELPELAVVGSSPERFLRVDADGRVESRPIKGTAPRSEDPAEDAARRRALAASEKDRAENLMIVDLVRNDLGRVCETGSIVVSDLFSVEPCASVWQLVSAVTGRLRDDCDALDAVAASFPPGSMTGAPKIAAMRVLDRLESVRRGFYSGALGYLDVRGGADLSVVIRTAFVRGGRVYRHTGGGIVADSTPEGEYAETLEKLRSLDAAIAAVGADADEPRTGRLGYPGSPPE